MANLKIHHLSKSYGSNRVLDNLTLTLSTPILGISGSNGSGKSTLLKCLAGLLKPKEGSVTWTLDSRSCSPGDLNGKIGYAAPYVELYEGLSVSENLQFLQDLKQNNLNRPHRISDLLERFEVADLALKRYGELSTGQRQRIKLAAACIHDPPILCLDEPGSNLDVKGREMVHRIIREFTDKNRMIIIATNQPDELAIAEEILNLDSVFVQ